MKCFIVNFNRLTLMKNLADFLSSKNIDVYIIDNNSSYPPLLDFYETTNYNVIKMDGNFGNNVFWGEKLYDQLKLNENYLLTDPDLDLTSIPDDFVEVLNQGLKKYPQFDKCGLSLKIDDLPDTEMASEIKDWEKWFWTKKLDDTYFEAPVDTTFALYKKIFRH